MRWRFCFSRLNPRAVLAGVAAFAVLVAVNIQAANTADTFTGGSTASLLTAGNWSLGAVPNVACDAIYSGSTTGIRSLTSGNLTVGSFDITGSVGNFTIRNNTSTSTDTILTLGGAGDLGNAVSGAAAGDLLYVTSGATFTLSGQNGSTGTGVLKVALGQNGNFDAAGTLNITAAISGSGFGFTKTGGGTLTLGGVNTYSGNTTISAGTLALSGSGSIANSACIVIEGSGTFDISALSGTLTLGAQVLKSPSTAATGTIKAGTSAGLTLGATSSLAFPFFSKTTPALTISGGTLTLNSSAAVSVVIKNSGTPLPEGDYKLIAKGAGGSVTFATTAPAVTVNGTGSDGIVGGGVASLQISGGELYLHVAAALLSAQSDIIRASAFTEPANISYANYQAATGLSTGNSIEMARFTLRDGGASADTDSAATTLNAITFNVANGAALRRVALFDGDNEIAETAGGATVTFSGLTGLTAADNGTRDFSVRATFNSTVTDNQQLQFTVGSATADAAGSTFAAADAGAAASSTSGDANRIEVTATHLAFTSVPATVAAGRNFTVTVQAQDANNNPDLDSAASVTITKATGGGTLSGGAAQSLSGGAQTWAALQMDTTGAFTLQAAATDLNPATSGSITALTPDATAILFTAVPTGSAWRTAGNWAGGAIPDGTQVAQFGLNPQSAGTVGINLNFTGNNQAVGAIEVTGARTLPLFIGDSSYTGGTLTLNGVTVNGTDNVILRNGSGSDATLQAAQWGAMGVVLGNATENKIIIDGTGAINIGGNISGPGNALTLAGAGSGALTLNGTNTYSGNTTISTGTLALAGGGSINNSPNIIVNGTLDVSGTAGGAYSLASGQTLMGTGIVIGPLVVPGGATVAPGNSIGTLTFAAPPTFSGTNCLEIDRAASPNADRIVLSGGTLEYGGTLVVANLNPGSTPASGDSFTLYAAGAFSGWFSRVTLPALAPGLSWDTNKLATTGVLDVYPFTTNAVQTMAARRNTAANLLIAKLLSKAVSSRGAVSLASVCAGSAQGGTVAVNGENICFTPATDYTGSDSLACVLTDGHGSIPATVAVTVLDPGSTTGNGSNLAIRPDGSGGMLIIIAGTTNVTYQVQCSGSLLPADWQDFGPPFVMPMTGITNIGDPGGAGPRYYRAILP